MMTSRMKKFIYVVKESLQKNSIVFFAMFYVMIKLTCNPLFFRQVNISLNILSTDLNLTVISSSFLFPVTYIISDMIANVYGRKLAVFMVIVGILCDGIFSFVISYVSSLPVPHNMTANQLANTNAVNVIGDQIWQLYIHGVFATIVTNVAEIFIFCKLMKKIKSFFISTVISVLVVLVFHNFITDYHLLKQPDVIKVILNGILINMSIMTIYSSLISILLYVRDKNN